MLEKYIFLLKNFFFPKIDQNKLSCLTRCQMPQKITPKEFSPFEQKNSLIKEMVFNCGGDNKQVPAYELLRWL